MKHTISGKLTRIEGDGDGLFSFTVNSKGGWAMFSFAKNNNIIETIREARIGQAVELTFEVLTAEEATV